MSRFTVGQEITPKETCNHLTRGKFYRVIEVRNENCAIINNEDSIHLISDNFGVTHEEYEQAEREKDPFAPGNWVVCVRDDTPAKVGDVVMVTAYHPTTPLGWFKVTMAGGPCNMRKSHFRPATPEEIKEQEMKIMDANRQTFTVGGQEFYVGQTVWAEKDGVSFAAFDELEVIGPINNAPLGLCVRKLSSAMLYFIGHAAITTTKPKPHEWKFGDWARHPDYGVVFVLSGIDCDGDIPFHSERSGLEFAHPRELTYISSAEIPE